MNLLVRQASMLDAEDIAPLIYEAIGDIAARLTGAQEDKAILEGLKELIQSEDNRHSYLYTYVAHEEEKILGMIVLYDGKTGKDLDGHLMKKLQKKHGSSYRIDKEAHDEEYYIDTVCVAPDARGRGIGTLLLHFAEQQAKKLGYTKLSLNVETEKTKARSLYEREGFVVTEPWEIIGEPFYHMVKEV
ncbi:GNAT family N-acetyltransferase [Lysinibacillus odysseyi]|uniref:Acetyltransferase n=1 Tax=Lysinibacillus odysseyi 34hs-1 = NBRC 100172 TaxID=1220589 RepID=A0A0A3IQY3_9BACI|nr:GNAT family N-acetyltransferase [Lysinibacillus odysseyi]KGR87189.1 acetyltransferase [Lysinibacillus odysseyi 34hs-1 = NBRC 100172]